MEPLGAHKVESLRDHLGASQGEPMPDTRALGMSNLNGASNAALCHTRAEPD
jgi:hypothetical protein